ncbi:MAG TPA: C1 family peptidase [Bacteroidales bacterium]|nr:C1 family peptidase [Bacteroidales bacterium]
MPIRMVKDRERSSQDNYPGGGGGGGGQLPGGLNTGCLTALLPLLLKNPKLLIIVLVVGAAIYFLGGQKSCSMLQQAAGNGEAFSLGGMLDTSMYRQAEIFEPLSDNVKNPMPERVSLEQYCPERLNQGQQGSCVAWSSAYAARSILQARQSGEDPDNVKFSPSFLYNQIGLDGCQGSYIIRAMEFMKDKGSMPFSEFPYNENDCSKQPNQYQLQSAEQFRTKGFNRLSLSTDDNKVDMLAVKQNLAQGAPVVIGMMVGGTFMQPMLGQKVWIPAADDYEMMGFGGHAMCVVGYDDYLEGGAFQIMNSWGKEWGENGLGWVRYKDFDFFVKEAYGLYPMGTSEKFDETKLEASFRLVNYDDNTGNTVNLSAIPLRYKGGITYSTAQPVSKNSTFKIEVTNNIECYTYVFGQETDGSSYVLFPYTPKHSPYCGITGTRLFPKDYSMKPDDVGSKDYLAIVVTKKQIDYNVLNKAISASNASTYAGKLMEALDNELVDGVSFTNDRDGVSFVCPVKGKNAVAIVIEVDKR